MRELLPRMAGLMKALFVVCIIIRATDAVVSIGLRGAGTAAGAAVPSIGGKSPESGGGLPSPAGTGAVAHDDTPEEWEVAFPDTPYEGKAKEDFLAFKTRAREEEIEFYKGEPLAPEIQALKDEYAAEVDELINKHDPKECAMMNELGPRPQEADPFLKMAHEYASNPNVPTPDGLKAGPNGPATVGKVFERVKQAKKLGALRPDRLIRKFLGQLREVSGNAQHWVCKLPHGNNVMSPTHATLVHSPPGGFAYIGATTQQWPIPGQKSGEGGNANVACLGQRSPSQVVCEGLH